MGVQIISTPILELFQIPALSDNYIHIVRDKLNSTVTAIDPGEAKPVFEFLKEKGWGLNFILNTHHHHDHIDGNEELKNHFKSRVICSLYDKKRIATADEGLGHGDVVLLGGIRGRAISIPGHTLGHMAYLFDKMLFSGDTLFGCGCGRLFEGTPEQMIFSLKKLTELDSQTLVFCGHEYTEKNILFALQYEPENHDVVERFKKTTRLREKGISTVPSTLEEELKTNPFLRTHSQEIRESLFMQKASDLDVFKRLREIRNSF